jgi:hypothetical protein
VIGVPSMITSILVAKIVANDINYMMSRELESTRFGLVKLY